MLKLFRAVSANPNVAERANTFTSEYADRRFIRFSGMPSERKNNVESFCKFSKGRIANDLIVGTSAFFGKIEFLKILLVSSAAGYQRYKHEEEV